MLKKINGQITRLLLYIRNNFLSFVFKLSVFSTMLILIYLVCVLKQADSARPSRDYADVQPIESSQKLMLTIPTDIESAESSPPPPTTEVPTTMENLIPKVEAATAQDFTTEEYVITQPFFPIQKQTTTPMVGEQATETSTEATVASHEEALVAFESSHYVRVTPKDGEEPSHETEATPTGDEEPPHATEATPPADEETSQEAEVTPSADEETSHLVTPAADEEASHETGATLKDEYAVEPSQEIHETPEDKVTIPLETSEELRMPHEDEAIGPLQSLHETIMTTPFEPPQETTWLPEHDAVTVHPEEHVLTPHFPIKQIELAHEAETVFPLQLLHETTTDVRVIPKVPSAIPFKRSLSLNELELFKGTTEAATDTTPPVPEEIEEQEEPLSTTTSAPSETVDTTTPAPTPAAPSSEDLFQDDWTTFLSSEDAGTQIHAPQETTPQSADLTTSTESLFHNEDDEFSAMEAPTLRNELKDATESHEHTPAHGAKDSHEVFKDDFSVEDKLTAFDTSPILSPNNLLNLFNFDHLPATSNVRPTRWSKSKNAPVPLALPPSQSPSSRHSNAIHSEETNSGARIFNRFNRFQNLDSLLNLRIKDSVSLLERLFGDLLTE